MALNKRKVLEAARKHSQKGAKAKALKEYDKLLKADPRDAKLLLEVGDAYRRWGQNEEAIAQYAKVAQQYRQDGFDARAVAVFKQILNLDPKNYGAFVSLSELYQRMGLDSEAISALQTAADGYHKEGRKTEALELLRQMAALDPTNTTSRLKVAELLRQEGMESEALTEYRAVIGELENQEDRDQLVTVLERMLELKSDDLEALAALVRAFVAAGELGRAEPHALAALDVSADPPQFEALMDLYAQMGDDAKLADATRGLAKVYRERGDEEKARELMQRLPAEEVGSSSRLAVDVSEIAEPELGDEELLGDDEDEFLSLGDEVEDLSAIGVASTTDALELELPASENAEPEIELELSAEEIVASETKATTASNATSAAASASATAEPDAIPEGDPDQLLAEASVYLRYGKREQALASLRGILAQDANHRGALVKLGEAYAEDGQNSEAVASWRKAAEQARAEADEEGLASLRERIAEIDPAIAEQIPPIDTGEVLEPDTSDALEMQLDIDLDLDDGVDGSEAAASGPELATEELTLDDEPEGDFEFEIDPDELSTPEMEGDGDGLAAPTEPDGVAIAPAPPSATRTGDGASTTTAAKIAEELEEAEFYLAQEMFDEAQTILERVLEIVPEHPAALLRMGEVAAARGETPDQVVDKPDPLGASATRFEVTTPFDEVSAETPEPAAAPPPPVAGVDAEASDTAIEDVSAEASESPTEQTPPREEAEPPSKESAPSKPDTESDTGEAIAAEAETPAQDAAADPADPGETFDLREALADVFADDDDSSSAVGEDSGVLSTVEDGFESIFSDFKKGVTEQLGEGDYDTRYDLGIAYREMGLFADAIAEFRYCLDAPERRFDSLYLMGLCSRDLGRFDDSVAHLEQALALPDLPEDRTTGVYFDLALAQQGMGDVARAIHSLERVIEADPDFPDAADRLEALRADETTSPELGEPGDGFESFDELFDEQDDTQGDAAVAQAASVETFESFDDLVSEAEAVIGDEVEASSDGGEAVAVAELIDEGEETTTSPEDTGSATRRGGRKKISFV